MSFDYGALIDEALMTKQPPEPIPKANSPFSTSSMKARSAPTGAPSELLGGVDGDEPARAFIMEQGREIAEKSSRPPQEIKDLDGSARRRSRSWNEAFHWAAPFASRDICP
jgi:hypothetical protein